MDMANMLDLFMLAMLLYVGGYGMYTVIRLRRERVLFKNRFLYPANCSPEDCTDEQGFIAYISPRLFIMSLVSLILLVALALLLYVFPALSPWWVESIVIPVIGVGVLAWFMLIQSRAYKRFW